MKSIFNIAEICVQKGLRDTVLSPGSRCAPLTISFVRHPKIQTRTISDERSAAFIAIGIAQQTKKTVSLVCTSGSAAYNYAPGIAEAYFQQIPLLIFTADRPPEWIDQLDGQTIRQNDIYGKHVKKSYTLPVDHSHPDAKWEIERTISEAINLTQEYPYGPVHINVPLREPFYPENGQIEFDKNVKVISKSENELSLSEQSWKELYNEYEKSEKKLIVAGQCDFDEELNSVIHSFIERNKIPFIADIISNFNNDKLIHHHDVILSQKDIKNGQPDLLITFGKSVISKNLKTYLRKYQPKKHWHIQPGGYTADTFQSLTKILTVTPKYFFGNLKKEEKLPTAGISYLKWWQEEEKKAQKILIDFFNKKTAFNEFFAVEKILKNIPDNSILHLANSMPVRYANYIGLSQNKKHIEVFANRGTSGIDGVISTTVGTAMSTDKIVTVLTGDMAFFYDRNALWNNYLPSNLRIVILNNHGGGIFRIIDGPNKQPELEEYFETKQMLLAENTAKDHNLEYTFCKNEALLDKTLKDFFQVSSKSKILEIETDSKINTQIFHDFKKSIT